MRRTSLLLVPAMLLLIVGTALAAGHLFTSPEGKFRVVFPDGFSDPRRDPDFQKMQAGPFKVFVSSASNGAMCSVMYRDLSRGPANAAEAKRVLESSRDAHLKGLNATPEQGRFFMLGTSFGHSYSFSGPFRNRTMYGQETLILVKARIYQVSYVSADRSELASPRSNSFFTSFQVMP